MSGPAYRIETPRLVIRCWEPALAPLLEVAITASIDHLRPWMPWAAAEPIDHAARVRLLRGFRGRFDTDVDYIYGILSADQSEVIGGTGLHPRIGEGAREIGYWISAEHVGRGYATEAVAALTRVAFDLDGVRRLEIRCDPNNIRSAAIPGRLGFTHEATLRHHILDAAGEPRDTMLWSLVRSDLPRSPASAAVVRAFGPCGERLL